MKNWKRQISIGIAALLATGSTASASTASPIDDLLSPFDDENRIDAANEDENNSLCTPNFGTGKFTYGQTFTITDGNGNQISDKTGLTFEIRGANNRVIDITNNITAIDELYSFEALPFDDLVPSNPLANIDPLSAPGLFGLQCQSTSEGTTVPFPSGTTLVALRGTTVIAIADISGRSVVDFNNTGISSAISETLNDDFIDSCVVQDVSVSTTSNCDAFSRIYSAAIDETGQMLRPFFAYFITLLVGIVHDQIGLSDGIINLGAASATNNSPSDVSAFNGVAPDVCLGHLDSFVNVLIAPVNDDPGEYELTQAGEDFADSLSDPSASSWSIVDSCLENYAGTPESDEDLVRSILPVAIVLLYFGQLLAIDIPLGNVASSFGGPNGASLPIRLTPPAPPQNNLTAVTTTTPSTLPVVVQSVRKKSQTLPETGNNSSDEMVMALLLLAAGALITLGRRRRQA